MDGNLDILLIKTVMMTKNLINVNKPTIGVIDTGTSNIKSVYYALIESNAHVVEIKNSSDTKRTIQALVVPGIGSFGFVMCKNSKKNNWINLF